MILSVPLTPLMAQLEAFYAYSGLTPGRPALLTVDIGDGARSGTGSSQPPDVTLEVPLGVEVSTPAIRFPAARQIVWRILPRTPGQFELRLRVDAAMFSKTLQVSTNVARHSPCDPAPGS